MIQQAFVQPETNAAYHADTTHVSHSMLERFIESPTLYHGLYVTKTIEREPPTPAMVLGSLTHALLLEPETLRDRYVEAVGCKTRTGKAWTATVEEAEATGKEPVLPSYIDDARAMADSVRRHPVAAKLFAAKGIAEQAIRWTDPATSLNLKIRPDWVINSPKLEYVICVDLKTAEDPRPEAFSKAVANYGYHRQDAMYRDGLRTIHEKTIQFLFVVVGKSAPHDVFAYQMATLDVMLGQEQKTEALIRLAVCRESGDWTTPEQNTIQTLELPRWARGS